MNRDVLAYRIVSFALYFFGMIYITILMPSIRNSMSDLNFVIVVSGFLLGLSRLAEYLSLYALKIINWKSK